VFILAPLAIGLAAAGRATAATGAIALAAMAVFMLRQPVSIAVKVSAGRRPRADLSPALFWATVYLATAAVSLVWLIHLGFSSVAYLAGPAIVIFAWHLWLVRRRQERRQPGLEIVAVGVMSLAAPAMLWATTGTFDELGWWLWVLTWLQAAASIVHAYLRLDQRG
jgi:hypothetical protein